jgi:hypothetical protein
MNGELLMVNCERCARIINNSPLTILMTFLRISMLGPLQVTVGETPAKFRTDAERVLLAYLAAHQGIPQRRDTLAALLSPAPIKKPSPTYATASRVCGVRLAMTRPHRPGLRWIAKRSPCAWGTTSSST